MAHRAELEEAPVQDQEFKPAESASRFSGAEVDLIDVAELLLREKRIILGAGLALFLLTAVVVYGLMKPMYTGQVVFLPPQNLPGTGSSMMQMAASQLGGSLGAMGALTGMKTPGDVYLGIAASRSVADTMVKKFDLQQVYKAKKLSAAEKELWSRTKFAASKTTTLITIKVEDHDPQRAADLANGYLDALQQLNGRLAFTESAQRRLFFEKQLEREKNALADAEVDLKKTQETTGIIIPSQAQLQMSEMAQLRAQIASHEVELAALRQGATDQNPRVVQLQSQIAGLHEQLRLFQSDSSKRSPGSIEVPTSKVPELALDYVRKQREVKYNELLFELIARQYEAAKLDESRDAPVLQVVDYAMVPDMKSGIPRTVLVLAGGLLGALFGASYVIFKAVAQRMKQARQNRKATI